MPTHCPGCHASMMPGNIGLCAECYQKLINTALTDERRCSICTRPISDNYGTCRLCKNDTYSDLKSIDAIFAYDADVRDYILSYKIHKRLNLKRLFAYLLIKSEKFREAIDAGFIIIPVPSSKNSFGSMMSIARELRKMYHIKVCMKIYSHAKKTQKTLSFSERKDNIANKIIYKGPALKKVLLVDDILTTGFTLRECVRVLTNHGVQEIKFLAISIVSDPSLANAQQV